jgi:hypothetical protein
MSFDDVVLECCQNKELIAQFNRLTGRHVLANLYDTRPPIVKMIDEATGYDKVLEDKGHEDMQAFISFIYECIWCRLPDNCFVECQN